MKYCIGFVECTSVSSFKFVTRDFKQTVTICIVHFGFRKLTARSVNHVFWL